MINEELAKELDGVEPDCFSSESLDTSSHLFWNKGQAMDYGFHRTKYYSAAKVLAFIAKMKNRAQTEEYNQLLWRDAEINTGLRQRNEEMLKEIAELKEKLKEEDKEWRNAFEVSEHDKDTLNARWGYIKTDIEGARALLILLRDGKGTPDDFDTMVDRIIESRKVAGL